MYKQEWSAVEVAKGQWWIIDGATGAACRPSAGAGERLWQSLDHITVPLKTALTIDNATEDHPFLDLDFQGVRTRYLAKDPEVLKGLAAQYPSLIPTLKRSPDSIIMLRDDADVPRLHRSVEGVRKGVEIFDQKQQAWVPASSQLPIVPLLQNEILAGRFAAIHGALIEDPSGRTIMICGHQKSGKTTATVLAKEAGFRIHTDELVLVDCTGRVLGVPLPIRKRNDKGRTNEPLPVLGSLSPVQVYSFVALERCAGEQQSVGALEQLGPTQAFASFAPHLRVLDTEIAFATHCAISLLSGAQSLRLRTRAWPDLQIDLQRLLDHFLDIP